MDITILGKTITVDINKMVSTGAVALFLYMGNTIYDMEKDLALVKYQLKQSNYVFQDIYEELNVTNYRVTKKVYNVK